MLSEKKIITDLSLECIYGSRIFLILNNIEFVLDNIHIIFWLYIFGLCVKMFTNNFFIFYLILGKSKYNTLSSLRPFMLKSKSVESYFLLNKNSLGLIADRIYHCKTIIILWKLVLKHSCNKFNAKIFTFSK